MVPLVSFKTALVDRTTLGIRITFEGSLESVLYQPKISEDNGMIRISGEVDPIMLALGEGWEEGTVEFIEEADFEGQFGSTVKIVYQLSEGMDSVSEVAVTNSERQF